MTPRKTKTPALPKIDEAYLLDFLSGLLNTPSPTGYSIEAIEYLEKKLKSFKGITMSRVRSGALLVKLDGAKSHNPRAVTGHVDTLGAMVRTIKSNGRLKMVKNGGFNWNYVEGEGCYVRTRDGKLIRGTILFEKSSSHVYSSDERSEKRSDDNMEIRLDIKSSNEEQTKAAGVEVGDYVFFDPRVEMVNDFVRSRFLDDKAGVACMVSALKALSDAKLQPSRDTYFFFSTFEEVGQGAAAGIPEAVNELLVVDMAAIGTDQNSDEYHASICMKDGNGPYHFNFVDQLRKLAADYSLEVKTDIYIHYGSDGFAFLASGRDAAVALIGPGIDASHNYERTHKSALLDTTKWILAYLLN